MTTTPLRTRTARVFVLDDDEAVRGGLADLLGAAEGVQVVGSAASTGEALPLVGHAEPDLVLLDARLPGTSGIGACRELRSAYPGIRCLLLTAFDDEEALVATALAGAAGHLVKQIGGTAVADELRRVAGVGDVVSPVAVAAVRARLERGRGGGRARAGVPTGTGRDDVLELVLQGCTDGEVAELLGLDPRAVRAEVLGLFARLGAPRRRPALHPGPLPEPVTAL